jgi:uncharacterized protein with HEPN domain
MSNRELLVHILEEVEFLSASAKGLTFKSFTADEVRKRAFARSLEIVGEAAKKLSPDFRQKHPMVEWRLLAGTRDKLIHDYFGVDYAIVWDIVTSELPELRRRIEEILRETE